MRHRVKSKSFNRDTKARKAMFKNLLVNLFEHGAIETTSQKAKQVKRLADKLISRAKPGTVQARRLLERFFGSKQVVNHLVDSVAPAMQDRESGFTTMTRIGRRRGDDADMVLIELVNQPAAKAEKAEANEEAKPAKKAEKAEKTEKAEKKTTKKSASSTKTEKKAAEEK
ncbi:50S ribosomal protein L17 [Candidatus Woesebacteria bacterium]|nr:50S ribosomal protein L17 [Candidatus Woesebacteria bacterium]MCD8507618.1 50S ribosomal protein L17 [Candidatus Woesebacteria bacterium]MCD8546458.1 50S ribosomal protein L17 [Candidatus Woesebacteria bacterium]